MILTLDRFKWTDTSTLGKMYIDNEKTFFSTKYNKMMPVYVLEDCDRDLYDYMTLKEIEKIKVPKQTAIPYGHYKVVIDESVRFKRLMPHILDVKGFSGIRIHNGSFVENTDACLLLGYSFFFLPDKNQHGVSKSKDCFSEFFSMLTTVLEREEVYLDIIK